MTNPVSFFNKFLPSFKLISVRYRRINAERAQTTSNLSQMERVTGTCMKLKITDINCKTEVIPI